MWFAETRGRKVPCGLFFEPDLSAGEVGACLPKPGVPRVIQVLFLAFVLEPPINVASPPRFQGCRRGG